MYSVLFKLDGYIYIQALGDRLIHHCLHITVHWL